MRWENSRSFMGKVFTSSLLLPNGWTATVTDDTEASAPFRGTKYHIQANCRFWGVGYPETYKTLAEAREVAEDYTSRMPPCDDLAADGEHCRGAWDVRAAVLVEWNRIKPEAVDDPR
jgi:hypothetical protein